MELGTAGLREQPFRTQGRPLVFVAYAAQERALEYLHGIYDNPRGLGLFQGPPLSGNSSILREFAEQKSHDAAVALVDGAGLNTTGLLQAALRQFGYELEFSSVNELLNMFKVFVMQQTASGEPPLLIVENAHDLKSSALRVLCELAELRVKQHYALRLVLASEHALAPLMESQDTEALAKRRTGNFSLGPMEPGETEAYLYTKMEAGGCADPESVLPSDVCGELHRASGGWPGVVDRLAILAMAKADNCPINADLIERPVLPNFIEIDMDEAEKATQVTPAGAPRIILTLDGETLSEMPLDRNRLLVGRSVHNDLCINSNFISRHHIMFVRFGTTTLLMDLNSTNGTYVNSRRISNQVMAHDDVISIGNHRIKFQDVRARVRRRLEGVNIDDTVMMKGLDDMRAMLAADRTELMPAPSDTGTAAGDKKGS